MKKTLEFILSQLVDHPEEIQVVEENTEHGSVLVIHANSEDIGKIIGKSGRIIRAIRDLIKIMAAKHESYIDVIIAEDEMNPTNPDK